MMRCLNELTKVVSVRRIEKSTKRSWILLTALFFAALLAGAPAHAQDAPKIDLFGGYSYVHANVVITGTGINLNGGSASVAYNVNHWFGVAFDFGGYMQGNVANSGASLTFETFLAGPRFSLRTRSKLTPFVQVLLGGGHAGGTVYTSPLGSALAPLGTSNAFAFTAGGGLDLKVSSAISLRLFQADYMYTQFSNANNNRQNNLRLSAGIVFNFGRR